MNRAGIVAILILGMVVRVRCGQATPAAGGEASPGMATPVAVETDGVIATALMTVEPTSDEVASPQPAVRQTTPTGQATATPRVVPSSTPTPPLPAAASPTCTPSPTPLTVRGVINRRAMNVRGGPGTEFPILTMVHQGQQVSVVGRTEDASWILILTPDGQQGWAWREFIEVESLERVSVSRLILATPTSAPP